MNQETVKKNNDKYIEAVGRRKTAVARVRIFESSKNSFAINDKELQIYFPTQSLQRIVKSPIEKVGLDSKFKIEAFIKGGGINSQAEAMRHGISRAVVKWNGELRKEVKQLGFLKRDPRAKERRKFGLKKARKAPQWSKR